MAVEAYTESQFVNAVYALLPPGEYWQDKSTSEQLSAVVEGIAKELYTTYVENNKVFLDQQDKTQSNWRIADYQALLDTYKKNATVSDNPEAPNVITILLDNADSIIEMMAAVENKRLPHTAVNYAMPFGFGLASGLRLITYQRIEAIG